MAVTLMLLASCGGGGDQDASMTDAWPEAGTIEEVVPAAPEILWLEDGSPPLEEAQRG